jgi:23S rRNA (uracil1939-C5)-methyltransferase
VEASAAALEHAEQSAAADRGRVSFTLGPAHDVAARLAAEGARFDVVILDPPRSGAAAVARTLPQIAAERVLYVSCSMPTLARDVALLARGGFRLDGLRLFDFYPQTAHVEALADLRRVAPSRRHGRGPRR